MKIDAHQHYWHPARGDYDWMPKDDPILYRPYGPSDLAPHLKAYGIDGSIVVQAAATVQESEYMLGLADATPSILAVVGWVDFEKPGDKTHLERLARHPKFVGVRPMIQDIPDDDWMLREDVQWGYRSVAELDLTFDALGFPRHLANFLTLLTRYPEMRTVIDHCMKPQIRDRSPDAFTQWEEGMRRLARETGAYCKFSALVTEADPDWTIDDLRPYVDLIFTEFGPDRILWGSDWPVCRLAAEYDRWRDTAEALTADLTAPQKARVFGGTAIEAYKLSV